MALNFANNNSLSAITSLPANISGGTLNLISTQTASNSATIDFTSGATDGDYAVRTAADENTFTVTASDNATISSTAVSVTLSGAGQYVCDSWTKTIKYSGRATISTTFREVFEP